MNRQVRVVRDEAVGGSEPITIGGELTDRQREANEVLASDATHTLLRGGSRSGKTFLICRAIVIRALKAKSSTHTILRAHFNHLKHSVIYDTMEKVQSVSFPGLKMRLDKTDWFHELPNGSRILYGGLDDKERTEKILGQEHSTIFLNECSNISFASRNKAVTRLAQNSGLHLRAWYDCNPPTQGHWTHAIFIKKIDPVSKMKLLRPDNFAEMLMNPVHNLANLPPGYIDTLKELPKKDRDRFLEGLFLPQVDGALWTIEMFKNDPEPVTDSSIDKLKSKMRRIVVAIDPSGCTGPEDKRSDQIGILVVGVDNQKVGHLLEDASGHYSPEQWASASIQLYDKWSANTIIGEVNYGGDMVRAVVHSVRKNVPFKKITASRGKHIRADPVSALYERKRVVHHGDLTDCEEQLLNFSTAGYMGERSPDRADAAIFGLTDLLVEGSSYTLANIR